LTLNRRISAQIDDPQEKRRYVRALFAGVAEKYDLTNDVMSFGLHRRWKRRVLELADLEPGQRVLDLAAGTGDLARGVLGSRNGKGAAGAVGAARGTGAAGVAADAVDAAVRAADSTIDVIAIDLTPEMLRVGALRQGPAPLGWVAGDAAVLPFPDGSFDRVLVGYGLRNFANLEGCLTEVYRCLRPGGRLVALDFGHPRSSFVRRGYFGYLNASTRLVGWALHRDAESYVYIPESLRRYPGQQEVARAMERIGYDSCGVEDLLFGTMAINFGDRPRS